MIGQAAWGSTTMLPPSQSGWTVAPAAAAGGTAAVICLLPDSLAMEAKNKLSFRDLAASGVGGDISKK